MRVRKGLTFDDLLLVPQHCKINSRSDISLDVDLGKGIKLSAPIVSANMKNVTGERMARALGNFGGLALLHRFDTLENQIKTFKRAVDWVGYGAVGCSVGVGEDGKKSASTFADYGCAILCLDVAHADHSLGVEMVEYISKNFPDILLIAGNVATASGARRLYEAGADVVKCGIGSGALCTTRIETGAGVPQMTALSDVFKESLTGTGGRKFKIIADGGLRRSGDCVKALCFSDAVMLGSMLAGTDEAPGEVMVDAETGNRFKTYAGSSTHKTNRVEGVIRRIPCKGPVKPILTKIAEGIQSGLSYQGCDNLVDLKDNPEFIEISNAGLIESHPHTY